MVTTYQRSWRLRGDCIARHLEGVVVTHQALLLICGVAPVLSLRLHALELHQGNFALAINELAVVTPNRRCCWVTPSIKLDINPKLRFRNV